MANITYTYPVAGTTPPAAPVGDTVIAGIVSNTTSADSVVMVHNMGLTTGQLAAGFPIVILSRLQASSVPGQWSYTVTDGNTITLNKQALANTASGSPQLTVTVMRPHSVLGSSF